MSTVTPANSAAGSLTIRFEKHRPDRFWMQLARRSHATATPAHFPSAVQDPEYFIYWREFLGSHEDSATPCELRKAFVSLYDAGLYWD